MLRFVINTKSAQPHVSTNILLKMFGGKKRTEISGNV